jgi:hypothetical protein
MLSILFTISTGFMRSSKVFIAFYFALFRKASVNIFAYYFLSLPVTNLTFKDKSSLMVLVHVTKERFAQCFCFAILTVFSYILCKQNDFK